MNYKGTAFEAGKKAGRKEVVDWITQYNIEHGCGLYIEVNMADWQEQLQKWGIGK